MVCREKVQDVPPPPDGPCCVRSTGLRNLAFLSTVGEVRLRCISLAVAVGVLGALVFAGSAQACSCVRMAPGKAMRQADAAIVGRLVEVVPRGRYRADYRYRVRRVYKHAPGIRRGRVISVRSATQSAACGLPSQIGRRYGLLLNAPPVVHPRDAKRGAGQGRPWLGGLCGVVAPRKLRSAARHSDQEERRSTGLGDSCTS